VNELIAILSAITTGLASIAGAAIAWMLYRLNGRQQKESWLRAFTEFHEAFWNDSDMSEVRCWIAYERAYLDIKPILQKRKDIEEGKLSPETLEKREYEVIDKLDKFLNLVLRVDVISSLLKSDYGQHLLRELFIDYWLKQSLRENRAELKWYVEHFLPELAKPQMLESKMRRLGSRGRLSLETKNTA